MTDTLRARLAGCTITVEPGAEAGFASIWARNDSGVNAQIARDIGEPEAARVMADALRQALDTGDDQTADEARRIGGGTANRYLAALLENALQQARAGYPLTELDLAALDEAATRISERDDDDDSGDYFGPEAEADARAAGFTVYERDDAAHGGRWAVQTPDGETLEDHHATEADAWKAAAAEHALSED